MKPSNTLSSGAFVEETRFGNWFLQTPTWKRSVLNRALTDLQRMLSLPIRVLFRHPMDVQRTAPEYMEMIRQAGFELPDANISTPYLWWSRPDVGFWEWVGRPVPNQREETMVNAVAYKPNPTTP